MKKEKINIVLKDKAVPPTYGSPAASGADIRAYLDETVEILPGESKLISTGIFLEIPEGFEVQVRPRSGLALKYQITVLNSPGTIDADYRGEIKIILINHGKEVFHVVPGMRIAQLVLVQVVHMEFEEMKELSVSARGEGGFGHTGSM